MSRGKVIGALAAMMGIAGGGIPTPVAVAAPSGPRLIPRSHRGLGARLAQLAKGGLRVVYPAAVERRPQGLRERRRRVRQIVLGIIPSQAIGLKREDYLAELQLAKKNYSPLFGVGGR